MDFTKLNLEFANMQNTITRYNQMINSINQRIKNNDKDINKYETKIKNTKSIIEKDSYKLMMDSIKNENIFLKQLAESEEKKVDTNDRK